MISSLIFVEPENAGNVGSIARAMSNFGVREMILVNPKCDIKSDECRALAKHAYFIVEKARIVTTFKKAVDGFDVVIGSTGKTPKDYDSSRIAYSPKEMKKTIQESEGRKALVIGREGSGLNADELNDCSFLVKINTNSDYPIMNASHAATVLLYELTSPEYSPVRKADRKETEILLGQFDEAVESLERIRDKEAIKKVFRNITARSILASRESFALTGFFKEIAKKNRQKTTK